MNNYPRAVSIAIGALTSIALVSAPAIASWVCGYESGTKACTSQQHVVVRSYTKGQTDHWAGGYHTLSAYYSIPVVRTSDSPISGSASWKAMATELETDGTYAQCGAGV